MKIENTKAGFVLKSDDGKVVGTFVDQESAERQKMLLEYQAKSKKPEAETIQTPEEARIKKDRENAASIYDMGKTAFDRGDYAQAAALFVQANRILPNKGASDAAFTAAQLDEQKRTGKAPAQPRTEVALIEEKGPTQLAAPDAYKAYERGKIEMKAGNYHEAAQAFGEAHASSPNEKAVHAMRIALDRAKTTKPQGGG